MSVTGSGIQVVQVKDDHTYQLNLDGLKSILMREEVKDLPVVVVSLAGAYRGGKSFMLNFFLRYLNASVSARLDGTWVGTGPEPLVGFGWRGGSKRNTTGIVLWSEPILIALPSGEQVVVLLMDTQGTFDSKSTVRDCSTIFALSTLLSSVQVYNLPGGNIQEDDLQHLQLFTEYGKLINDEAAGHKAFQVLEFLIRDWGNDFENAYGSEGGQQYLNEVLKVTDGMPKELSDLRRHIASSFETVSCFLMPHPGLKVKKKTFTGSINEIEPEFVTYLKELATSLFGQQKLKVKMINGHAVKASELFTYFNSYMSIFNSESIPTPTSIMKATTEAGMLVAVNKCRDQYERHMQSACGEQVPSLSASDLQALHNQELQAARTAFTALKKMGSKLDSDKYLEDLTKDLDNRLPTYMSINMGKTQKAVIDAKEAYQTKILGISGDKPLCVHAADLEQVHEEAKEAAINLFDSRRKRNQNKDDERTAFIKSLDQQLRLLKITNEQNNKIVVSELVTQYWQEMQTKTTVEPPLSSSMFEQEHENALRKALGELRARRNRQSSYTEDVYVTTLTNKINSTFMNLQSLNKSKNKEVINKALVVYSENMESLNPTKDECLHPDELLQHHETAKCRAWAVFHPHQKCIKGFHSNDEDEETFLNVIQGRFYDFKDLNNMANKKAIQMCLNKYNSQMEELCRPTMWWILIIPIINYMSNLNEYHDACKANAINTFYNYRLSGTKYDQDEYRDNLAQLIDEAFKTFEGPKQKIINILKNIVT